MRIEIDDIPLSNKKDADGEPLHTVDILSEGEGGGDFKIYVSVAEKVKKCLVIRTCTDGSIILKVVETICGTRLETTTINLYKTNQQEESGGA